MSEGFFLTGKPEADALLRHDRLALLIGMLLDQQVAIEWAFAAPATLRARLAGAGVEWSAAALAGLEESRLVELFCAKPALHRFPAVMARRCRALCAALVEDHGGDASHLWDDGADAVTVLARTEALPGFGAEKAKIFLALLGKRFGVTADGWMQACAPFGDDQPRTVADISSPASLDAVRAWKRDARRSGRSKAD